MKHTSDDVVIVNLLKQAVESEGCKLTEVDFENNIIKVDGPEAVVADCARAVAEIID